MSTESIDITNIVAFSNTNNKNYFIPQQHMDEIYNYNYCQTHN